MEPESLWIHPYCHSSEEAHQGTALPQPQEHSWAAGCPNPTSIACLRGSSGEVLAYGYPPPTLTYYMGLSFSFAFLSPLPRALGPLSPPIYSFWPVVWWLLALGGLQQMVQLVVSELPTAAGTGTHFPRAALRTQCWWRWGTNPSGIKGRQVFSVLDKFNRHLNTSKSGILVFS